MTTVSDLMTRGVRTLTPADTVTSAARAMDELNVGVIPVCDGEKLVGMVTDRDIVVRGVAQELDAKTTDLSDLMSTNVRTARENEDVDEVLSEMAESQIRRLPVVDDQDRLVGIISLGDIAAKDPDKDADVAASLGNISLPAEPDRSNQSRTSGEADGSSATGKPPRKQRG